MTPCLQHGMCQCCSCFVVFAGTSRCEIPRAEFADHMKHLQTQYSKRVSEFGDVLEYEQKLEQQQQQQREK